MICAPRFENNFVGSDFLPIFAVGVGGRRAAGRSVARRHL